MPIYISPLSSTSSIDDIYDLSRNLNEVLLVKRGINAVNGPVIVENLSNYAIDHLKMWEIDDFKNITYFVSVVMPSLWTMCLYQSLLELSIKKNQLILTE